MLMRRSIVFSLLVVGFCLGAASAGEIREVELIDGSVIRGEIVSSEGGIYTLKTDTLGTVTIEASKSRAIRFKPSVETERAVSGSMGASTEVQVKALQQLMMSDQELVRMILSLLNDPEIQAVLEDPSIIQAMNAGDIGSLTANPKFMKLLENPAIQDITNGIGE
jgi:hypothetical protein